MLATVTVSTEKLYHEPWMLFDTCFPVSVVGGCSLKLQLNCLEGLENQLCRMMQPGFGACAQHKAKCCNCHLSCNLNSLKGGLYRGLYSGLL